LLIIGPLLWAAFSWLPASRITGIGARLTVLVTPLVVWLLNLLQPLLGRGSDAVHHRITVPQHTGLFERGDLIDLIEQQQRQHDSRLTEDELEIARRALSFDDYKVSDVLVPRKSVKTILAGDTIGPVLIDELHKNGQGYTLVRETPKGDFTGTLAFGQLNLKSTGQVQNVMDKKIYYLHENDSLSQALHAFFKTNCPVFVVTNSSEEFVGIITIDNILRQLLGHIPGDDFENYSDISAVATRHIKEKPATKKTEKADEAEEKSSKSDDTPVKTDDEVVK
jgi:CBS domain containing-hemolysin-like protein